MIRGRALWCSVVVAAVFASASVYSQALRPCSNASLSPDQRAALIVAQMTFEEKMSLVHGHMPMRMKPMPDDVVLSAGYFPGVPRLGVPALRETDASLGVANAGRQNDDATALPSGLALASTWNPELMFAAGQMIGKQTRQKGFNILLAGGVNLVRDPYNGRNFEYLSEDPLLSGVLAGASIKGIQSQKVVSTAKHFVLNSQETGRYVADARISEAALRESDLLAFQIAIEQGDPGSVMCSYNKLNGPYACESSYLLKDVLKTDWGFKGWVMSDWGAVHSVGAANAGLDQQSGQEVDKEVYFDGPLRAALASGEVSQARLDDMVTRIMRGMFANGLMDQAPDFGPLNTQADNAVAQMAAEAGIVLLKNKGAVLPLKESVKRIAVIGPYVNTGVLSGGGSSQVAPAGTYRVPRPEGTGWVPTPSYHPSVPVKAIAARAEKAEIVFDTGADIAAAAKLASSADVVILFAEQWTTETRDVDLHLSEHQEKLIAGVAAANAKTVVVLTTGGSVLMPWAEKVPAIVAAWYPGGRGAEAITRVLFGDVNPSGRLPITFAARVEQWPRQTPPGRGLVREGTSPVIGAQDPPFAIDYAEGSSLGYRWFAEKAEMPLYPFGYGLSYTTYRYSEFKVTGGDTAEVSVSIKNTGRRSGTETAQVYLRKGPHRSQLRLLGWAQAVLKPGEYKTVTIKADPRLLANWDEAARAWRIDEGTYEIFVGPNASEAVAQTAITMRGRTFAP